MTNGKLKRLIDRCREPARLAIRRYQRAPYHTNLDPNDIACETAWRARAHPAASRAALRSIAGRVIVDRLRSHRGRSGTGRRRLNDRMCPLERARFAEAPGPLPDHSEVLPMLRRWLQCLPPQTRRVMDYLYLRNFSLVRVGAYLHLSRGRTQQLETEGLRRLRFYAQNAGLLKGRT